MRAAMLVAVGWVLAASWVGCAAGLGDQCGELGAHATKACEPGLFCAISSGEGSGTCQVARQVAGVDGEPR